MSQTSFDHIVFDLDDTLLDTYGQLIPKASREACIAMIEAGLATDLETCLAAREALARTDARTDLYRNLVARFGVRDSANTSNAAALVAEKGYQAFHERRVERDITLFPGTRDLLRDLRTRYHLHLVTAGHVGTQQAKINILNLTPAFSDIHIVDLMKGEKKGDAFEAIAKSTGAEPTHILSVGNRLDTDIAPAKRIGWKTCWIAYGEHAHALPKDDFEKPDYQIADLKELISVCRL